MRGRRREEEKKGNVPRRDRTTEIIRGGKEKKGKSRGSKNGNKEEGEEKERKVAKRGGNFECTRTSERQCTLCTRVMSKR